MLAGASPPAGPGRCTSKRSRRIGRIDWGDRPVSNRWPSRSQRDALPLSYDHHDAVHCHSTRQASPTTVDDGVLKVRFTCQTAVEIAWPISTPGCRPGSSVRRCTTCSCVSSNKKPHQAGRQGRSSVGSRLRTCRVASGHHRTLRAPSRGEAWIEPSRMFSRESGARRRFARDDRRHGDAVGDRGLHRCRPQHRCQ